MIDLRFLAAIIDRQEPEFLFQDNLHQALHSDAQPTYTFIQKFHKEYNKLPVFDTIQEGTGLNLGEWVSGEPAQFYADTIRKRYLRQIWIEGKGRIATAVEHDKIRGGEIALQVAQDLITRSQLIEATKSRSISMFADERTEYRREEYLKKKSGKGPKGILTPWDVLNEMSLGIFPGDLVSLVGVTGVGKTFFMLLMALEAAYQGNKVLFGSLEMPRDPLEIRADAMHNKFAHHILRRATLGGLEEPRYMEYLANYKPDGDIIFVDPSGIKTVPSLEATIESIDPDIVFVDSFYKMSSGSSTAVWEQVSKVVWELKTLAIRRNLPMVVSGQFNRKVTRDSRGGQGGNLQDVAFAYAVAQDSDWMLGLNQSTADAIDEIMSVKVLKLRNDETSDFYINWNLDAMIFDPVDIHDVRPEEGDDGLDEDDDDE